MALNVPASQVATLTGLILGNAHPHGKGKGGSRGVGEEHSLTALLGSEGVTPTAGWGKWAKVQRRQRTAVTVLEGYDPYTITVPLLLDARALGLDDVEQQVLILEWFGGRGTLFKDAPAAPGVGETPLIQLSSASDLVPAWCQSLLGSEGSTLYVVDSLEYNMCGREWIPPMRKGTGAGSNAGRRVRQAATLTLLQYVGPPNSSVTNAVASRLIHSREHKFLTWTVHGGVNTFKRIAKHFNRSHPRNIPDAARVIQQANPRYGTSVDKLLPGGARIKVPESATSKRI